MAGSFIDIICNHEQTQISTVTHAVPNARRELTHSLVTSMFIFIETDHIQINDPGTYTPIGLWLTEQQCLYATLHNYKWYHNPCIMT
jgi:hypothetical protein